jgi:hypothetical protein
MMQKTESSELKDHVGAPPEKQRPRRVDIEKLAAMSLEALLYYVLVEAEG